MFNPVLQKSLASLLINISAGLILTLMTTVNTLTLLVNLVFAIISFKLAVDLESAKKSYDRSHRKS